MLFLFVIHWFGTWTGRNLIDYNIFPQTTKINTKEIYIFSLTGHQNVPIYIDGQSAQGLWSICVLRVPQQKCFFITQFHCPTPASLISVSNYLLLQSHLVSSSILPQIFINYSLHKGQKISSHCQKRKIGFLKFLCLEMITSPFFL